MSVKNFMDLITKSGGLSYSNTYDIEWIFPTINNGQSLLVKNLKEVGIQSTLGGSVAVAAGGTLSGYRGDVVKLFCDEAQLPNISAQTGQTSGVLLGEGQVSYPHTRVFTDFQLGWICDADMTPLKFLNVWYNTIFGEYLENKSELVTNNNLDGGNLVALKNEAGGGNSIQHNRSIRLNYPEQYLGKCLITKAEKGVNASNSRASMTYTMLDCYPYSIDAVPLSAGTSQATKVTASFYYSKHTVTYNDISNFRG